MNDHAQFIVKDGSVSFICDSIIFLHHCCGLVITKFGACSYQCSLSNFTPVL